jgi:hypothetical protein
VRVVVFLWAVTAATRCFWWVVVVCGCVVKCRVDASIFFLDLYRPCMPPGVRGLWFA